MGHPLGLLHDLGLAPVGLIHVGASTGQEFEDYRRAGLRQVLYIEPIRYVYEELKRKVERAPGHCAVNALCAERDDMTVDFRISSNDGHSSSMLDFGWHASEHPDVHWVSQVQMTTSSLDTVVEQFCHRHPKFRAQNFDCLVLDTQGSEMRVFQGGQRALSAARFIYTEVNEGGLYSGDASVDDVITFLKSYGFRLKNLQINRNRWGDALFVRHDRP